jgi:hypothetical protein
MAATTGAGKYPFHTDLPVTGLIFHSTFRGSLKASIPRVFRVERPTDGDPPRWGFLRGPKRAASREGRRSLLSASWGGKISGGDSHMVDPAALGALFSRLGAMFSALGVLSALLGAMFSALGVLSARLGAMLFRSWGLLCSLGAAFPLLCSTSGRAFPQLGPSLLDLG